MERVLFTGMTGKSGSVLLVEELSKRKGDYAIRVAVRETSNTERLTKLIPAAELRGGYVGRCCFCG